MSEELCNAVVARLRGKMPTFSAEYFPDAPQRYPWAGKDKTLLVGFEGSAFGPVESLDPPSSDESVDFSVTVLARSLRGPAGVSQVLREVRKALLGWRPVHSVTATVDGEPVTTIEPLGFRPIAPLKTAFVGEDNGTWRYVAMFRSPMLAVADVSDPNLIGAPFVEATFKEPDPP